MPQLRSANALVEVRDLTKHYGRVVAVRDVGFAVGPGEIFGLLGRNGAGKTTTLECILGLRRPDAGAVTIAGIDALAQPERARAVVGAQLQSSTLQDKLTPRQALRLFGGFFRAALPTEGLLERFGLTAAADAPFDTLSGGQRQRLLLALAFVHQPRVVVLDEPTVGLDPPARRELHALIEDLRRAGVAVLLSTHYLEEAEHLCDRIGILERGRLIAVGPPRDLIARAHAVPRIFVRAARPIALPPATGLAGVTACDAGDGGWLVEAADVNAAIVSLVRHLSATQNTVIDLQIRRPTLEDAFVELTGGAWEEGPAQ